MKPGPEKEFEKCLSINMSKEMYEYIEKESEKYESKKGAMGMVARQAIIDLMVKNQMEEQWVKN